MNVNIRQKNILVFIGFSAFFLLFLRTQPASSAPNLVAEYHFDETSGTTTADSSGNGNNGTLVNGPVWTTNGKIGSALVFDGVNDYVDAGNSPSLNPANQITIAAWAKPSSIAQSQFIVAKDNVPAGTLQYFLRFQGSSGVRFAIRTSVDNYFTVSTPTAIATNTWYHVVGVYDGSTMKVYVNGTLLGSTNVSGLMANNGVNVRIGRRQDTALPFNGVIDEVKIYDRALSQSEVMGLYDNTSPSTPANLTATAVSASQISLSWQASTDNVAVTGYQVFRDGLQIATTTTTSYSSTGLQPSTLYTYTTSAFDGAGNISAQSVSAQATTLPPPDTTPPVVSVTSPLSGATVSGTIPISANATDNVGVAGVQFKLDGANLSAEDATLPYGISWDTATASEGLHTLTAVARDAAGNSATSTPISVTVDNIPPDITPPIISNISSSANISDATITWTTDELADSQVEYGTTQTYGSSSVLVSTFTTMHSVNITNLSASATYHYRVKSKDPSGNLAVSGDFMFNTQSPPPPPGPVGYWKLDDASGTTTADSSGNGNNGSLTNGPVWTTGKVNGGLSFDGVDDYVLIPNSPSLSPTTAITLTAWVNISNTNTTKMIVAKYDSTGASYFLRVGGSRVRFNVNAGGTLSGPPDSATLLSPNTWYHIVGTYDGTQAKLYINGLLNTSIAKSGAINVTSLPVNIGRHGSNLMFMQGLIDEVRVYDRALSQSEVTALYNFSGTPSDTQPPSVSITSPAAASSVAGTIKVDVSASDNVQVASVELYKDNQFIRRVLP
ncbi:MAG: fibronectin type III domain-containing protein [Candidatus Doudnabacteria bacterium]|nr:fibronectin type III domain-containing protein [Candidatus Doudnabacteria bacterium]